MPITAYRNLRALLEYHAATPICKGNPTIWVYKMTHDMGTAPCVEDDLLTLAICKPAIRRLAKIGHFVIGIGAEPIGMGRVIFAAKITGKTGATDEYYRKYPNREDAIFEPDKNGFPIHKSTLGKLYKGKKPYDHPQPHWVEDDVGLQWEKAQVLLSNDYRYFGEEGTSEFDYYSDVLKWATVGWGVAHNPVTSDKPYYPELCQFLQDLWSRPSVQNKPTHPDTEKPDPSLYRTKYDPINKEVRAWKKANPNVR